MRMGRVMRAAVLVAGVALGACGQGDFDGGDTQLEDMEGGVPEGAIPAPEASPANPAAAGVPADSAGAAGVAADSVTPELGR